MSSYAGEKRISVRIIGRMPRNVPSIYLLDLRRPREKISFARSFAAPKKLFFKLTSLVLLVALFATLSLLPGTNAWFADSEKSAGNAWAMGSLNFSVGSAADFSPKVLPSNETIRSATLSQDGTMKLKYKVTAINFSGPICAFLEIKDDLSNTYQPLNSYISAVTDNATKTNWNFTARLTGNDDALADEVCNFDLNFEAWQDNLLYGAGGFSDSEILASIIESDYWTNIADHLVVNEVYYDVAGDKGAEGDNEWVEIYNPTSASVNIKNWQICDNNGCDVLATDDLNLPANGYAVVTNKATTWDFWPVPGIKIALGSDIGNGLSNDGDQLILKNDSGTEIDAMSYGDDATVLSPACPDVAEGHSLARKPAGQDTGTQADFENLVIPNPGTNPHTVVMNEIMPDPVGDDDAAMEGGEWIELYNFGEYEVDVQDWMMKDKDGNTLKITDKNSSTGQTKIPSKERLVVYRNGDGNFTLDSGGDSVSLFDEKELIKDSYAYLETQEGKSIARFPDGIGVWIDPEETPGEENILSAEETEKFQMYTFDECFKSNKLDGSDDQLCDVYFLKYLGMIGGTGDEELNVEMELKILEMKKVAEEKKMVELTQETAALESEPAVVVPPVSPDPTMPPAEASPGAPTAPAIPATPPVIEVSPVVEIKPPEPEPEPEPEEPNSPKVEP